MGMDSIDKCDEFMSDNKVSFEQMIRCFNFWNGLDKKDRGILIEAYEDGAFDMNGWY